MHSCIHTCIYVYILIYMRMGGRSGSRPGTTLTWQSTRPRAPRCIYACIYVHIYAYIRIHKVAHVYIRIDKDISVYIRDEVSDVVRWGGRSGSRPGTTLTWRSTRPRAPRCIYTCIHVYTRAYTYMQGVAYVYVRIDKGIFVYIDVYVRYIRVYVRVYIRCLTS